METIKKFLGMIPSTVWVVLAIVALVMAFWFKDDLGSWWEGRKQAQFDAKIAEQQKVIDDLTKQKEEAIAKAEQAEAREQAKIIEADLLKQEAAKHGVNIEAAQKVIDEATKTYQEDQAFIEKVNTGEITKLQLCQKQCKDSAEMGYPCRANYCDKFKE